MKDTKEVKEAVRKPRWKNASSATLSNTETGTKLLHIKYDRGAIKACKDNKALVVALRQFSTVFQDLACEINDAALEARYDG